MNEIRGACDFCRKNNATLKGKNSFNFCSDKCKQEFNENLKKLESKNNVCEFC